MIRCVAITQKGERCKKENCYIDRCKIHYKLGITDTKWHKKRFKKVYKKLCQGLVSWEEYIDERIPTSDLCCRRKY